MAGQGRDHAIDHVVVVVFENRSLDNVLGRLYGRAQSSCYRCCGAACHHLPLAGPGRPGSRCDPTLM